MICYGNINVLFVAFLLNMLISSPFILRYLIPLNVCSFISHSSPLKYIQGSILITTLAHG